MTNHKVADTKCPAPSTKKGAHYLPLSELASSIRQTGLVQRTLQIAFDEDLGPHDPHDPHGQDWTGQFMFSPDQTSTASLIMRQPGIVAGLAFVPDILNIFLRPNETLNWTPQSEDGALVKPGDALGSLTGSSIALVRVERTLLNLVSRMSGIATRTNQFVQLASGTQAQICDTRKTTPGFRVFEKYAVRCGGGTSHRMGLFDAILIKDNHLAGLGEAAFKERIQSASAKARQQNLEFVQVEVDTLKQLGWVLELEQGTVDIVLLDNMPPETLTKAVAMRNNANPKLQLESSGGINESTLPAIAKTGVDRISIGGLTHQAVSLDIGLDIETDIQ
ncbi:MAG: carboxylating nicotinate-nucleotide diphosphorylase [Phycisphaerales bacterium]|nr:carboxylating nicotinate-nucleotide diphosphorylase [Phycisphaerales bacterium]